MKILKTLRKPYLSIFMSGLILFVSCEQYDVPVDKVQNKFDYSVFVSFKNSEAFDNIMKTLNEKQISSKYSSNLELNKAILEVVNEELGTSVALPDLTLQLSDFNFYERLNVAFKNGLINDKDVYLINTFTDNLKTEGFEKAIKNYEESVLELTISPEEFAQKNTFVNIMKGMSYEYPYLFDSAQSRGSWWRCALAVAALAAAIASTSSCLTVFACGLALVAVASASYAVRDNCATD